MEAKNMMAMIKHRQAASKKMKTSAVSTSMPARSGKYRSVKSVFRERKAKKIEKQESSRREKAIPIVMSFFCGFIGFMRLPLYNTLDHN
jgi:hypothetical protein